MIIEEIEVVKVTRGQLVVLVEQFLDCKLKDVKLCSKGLRGVKTYD